MLIDTHTHLYLKEFDHDRQEVIEAGLKEDVQKMLLPNIDTSTIPGMLDMVKKYPGVCYPMAGLHPGSVGENYREDLSRIRNEISKGRYIAIGEIGIDLYWEKKFRKEQEEVFEIQLEWAKETGLPVVIHARESFQEIFKVMDRVFDTGLRGVFHSFTGNEYDVEKIKEYDFYFGINGIVTFKNSTLKEIVKLIPENRLLLETDSPYLAPVPKRGRRNESSYLRYTCNFLAEFLGIERRNLERITTENALKLFKL